MDTPLQIHEVSSPASFIRVFSPPTEVPPGGQRAIPCEVQANGREPGRVQQSSIRVVAANARMTMVEVPVLVRLK
jgi:hypothetical protein